MQRYFVEQTIGKIVIITDTEIVHHIKNVMRNKVKDEIILVSDSSAFYYQIVTINDKIECSKLDKELKNPELNNKVDFAIPFLKKDNFEIAIQKLVETGVNNILPIDFKRSVVKIDCKKWNVKKARYQKIMKSASMQCQRNKLSQIKDIVSLDKINYQEYDLVILCYELEEDKLISSISDVIKSSKNILVIIGPEGGIDASELKVIKNAQIVSLGSRILRAETAIISAMYYISVVIEGV